MNIENIELAFRGEMELDNLKDACEELRRLRNEKAEMIDRLRYYKEVVDDLESQIEMYTDESQFIDFGEFYSKRVKTVEDLDPFIMNDAFASELQCKLIINLYNELLDSKEDIKTFMSDFRDRLDAIAFFNAAGVGVIKATGIPFNEYVALHISTPIMKILDYAENKAFETQKSNESNAVLST